MTVECLISTIFVFYSGTDCTVNVQEMKFITYSLEIVDFSVNMKEKALHTPAFIHTESKYLISRDMSQS